MNKFEPIDVNGSLGNIAEQSNVKNALREMSPEVRNAGVLQMTDLINTQNIGKDRSH